MYDPDDKELQESLKYLQVSPKERMELQSKQFDSKIMCWVPDEKEGFVAAQITGTQKDKTEVKLVESGQSKTVKTDEIEQMNPPKFEKCDDMADLTFLNDPSVLNNLRVRYKSFLIYTYSGLFCVVINPYKRLPIYTEKVVRMYRGKKRNEVPPHLFAIADNAYANMLRDRENQSMLITGESGAGKTENTKKVIQYFATVAAASERPSGAAPTGNLEDQIISANPLMEAYGNAKTTRNNNSSRFGKFIRIHFGNNGKIAGADIATYLLEKARVIFQQKAERNYHIFYQIMQPCAADLQKKLLLEPDPTKYLYSSHGCVTVDGIDDNEEMKLTLESCKILQFSEDDILNMLKCTGAILHFGNSKWKQRPREEQAELDGAEECEKVAFLLSIEAADLIKSLLKPRIKVGNEYVNKGQNKDQVVYAIGALSKAIYERLFNWMLVKINMTLDVKTSRQYFIGVLDIAGFEIFEYNGFEQLCINYTNEMLQQFFNHHMFVLEQEEYKKEGIQWDFIDFGLDLQACIDLIEKPMGILSMLEEECIVPKGSDKGFIDKLENVHFGKHPNISKPKAEKGKPPAHFLLQHYAGAVPYSVDGWLEKNKDPINNSVATHFANSKNPVLAFIFKDYLQAESEKSSKGKGKKGGSMRTISAMHRDQLATLMMHLRSTHPHFVRCIIPNEHKQPGELDAELVLNQLHCNGVLEGIRICRKGFPNRMIYSEFKQRYSILAPNAVPKGFVDAKKATAEILKEVELSGELYKLGHTKIFFKSGVLAQLEDLRDIALGKIITKLQGRIRAYVMKILYRRMAEQKLALDVLQRNCYKYLAFRNWPWWKLYTRVKPLLSVARQEEDMKKLEEELEALKQSYAQEQQERQKFEEQSARLTKEKNDVVMELEMEKANTIEAQERADKLVIQKADLEGRITDLNERLEEEEDNVAELSKKKRAIEDELDIKASDIENFKTSVQKLEGEKRNKDTQITNFQNQVTQYEDQMAKFARDKKRLEDELAESNEKLQSEEDKANNLNKVKGKMEQNLDELEDALEREKKARVEMEKAKRKLETDLRSATASLEEVQRSKEEMEGQTRSKDQEISTIGSQLEEEQRQVASMSKKMKELQNKVDELEEEVDMERQGRSKAEKQRQELSRELEDIGDKLEEVGGSSVAQTELGKKREAELAKLRRDLDEATVQHEAAITQLKKKHQDAVNEMGQQIEQLQRMKSKLDKDKAALSSENTDLKAQLDNALKGKVNAERLCKQLEQQISDVNIKLEEGQREINDLNSAKSRLTTENAELSQQVEDLEHSLGSLNKAKQHMQAEIAEIKAQLDEETRAKSALTAQLRNVTADLESANDQLDQEIEEKTEIQKMITRLNGEVQQWKSRYETEGLARSQELEDAKRKLAAKLAEAEEQVESALNKCIQLEKVKQRLQGEVEDLVVDVERANSNAAALEKKQRQFDKMISDWKKKCDDVSLELESSQKEARTYSAELFKVKTKLEDKNEEIEALKRDNKGLSDEIKDLLEQSSEGARNIHEVMQEKKRLEGERDELQAALEESEVTIEQEEAKAIRLQMEVSSVRQEVDRRLREKDEEFDATRRNHQRVVESMQASLESEVRAKQESMRQKKKLESDVNELEVSLDQANRSISDQQKNLFRVEGQLKEAQVTIEEEQAKRDEAREAAASAERRFNMLVNEVEEIRIKLDQSDASRRAAEIELVELSERLGDLTTQNANLGSQKKQMETALGSLQSDLDEAISELKESEENAKQSHADAARLVEELRSEQEHSLAQEAVRKSLEQQFKDLQARYEEIEANAIKGGKKIIQKLEEKIHNLSNELEGERHISQEAIKNGRRNERRVKELTMQIEEDHRNQLKLQDTVEKLGQKIKLYKRQVEEAEEIAGTNLAKYRKVVQDLETAEERADSAETMFNKLRAKSRGASTLPGGMPVGGMESHDTSRAPSMFSRGPSLRR